MEYLGCRQLQWRRFRRNADDQRRIINVSKGRISAKSTDAVNGSQIYYLANDLMEQITNAGGSVAAGTNIASVVSGTDADGTKQYTVNAENASVSVDDNFALTSTTNDTTNITDYHIALKDIVTIGSTEGSKITIDGTKGQITGLTNKTLDVENFATVGRAATEEQLKAAMGDMKADQQLRDQHLVANPDGGNYVVDDKGEVTLKVKGAPDEDGNATYSDVVIEDVASKKKFDEIVGDGQYFHNETGKGNVVNNDMNITEAIEALDKAVDNAATEAGKHRTVSAGNGIKVEKTEATDDKEADYNVSLANDITLTGDDGTNTIHINANDGSITRLKALLSVKIRISQRTASMPTTRKSPMSKPVKPIRTPSMSASSRASSSKLAITAWPLRIWATRSTNWTTASIKSVLVPPPWPPSSPRF